MFETIVNTIYVHGTEKNTAFTIWSTPIQSSLSLSAELTQPKWCALECLVTVLGPTLVVGPCEALCKCVCVLNCNGGHVAAFSLKAATDWRLPPKR